MGGVTTMLATIRERDPSLVEAESAQAGAALAQQAAVAPAGAAASGKGAGAQAALAVDGYVPRTVKAPPAAAPAALAGSNSAISNVFTNGAAAGAAAASASGASSATASSSAAAAPKPILKKTSALELRPPPPSRFRMGVSDTVVEASGDARPAVRFASAGASPAIPDELPVEGWQPAELQQPVLCFTVVDAAGALVRRSVCNDGLHGAVNGVFVVRVTLSSCQTHNALPRMLHQPQGKAGGQYYRM